MKLKNVLHIFDNSTECILKINGKFKRIAYPTRFSFEDRKRRIYHFDAEVKLYEGIYKKNIRTIKSDKNSKDILENMYNSYVEDNSLVIDIDFYYILYKWIYQNLPTNELINYIENANFESVEIYEKSEKD